MAKKNFMNEANENVIDSDFFNPDIVFLGIKETLIAMERVQGLKTAKPLENPSCRSTSNISKKRKRRRLT